MIDNMICDLRDILLTVNIQKISTLSPGSVLNFKVEGPLSIIKNFFLKSAE